MKKKSKFFVLPIVFVIFVLDQFAKSYAGKFFSVTCNKGIAFGVKFADPFDIVLPAIFTLIIFYFVVRESRVVNIISMSMIVGGGVSNLADRVIGGCVRDFIPFGSFSTFNVADFAITLGVVLFLINIGGRGTRKSL
ncbi:hypothetical protein A2165_04045 [Candidatus Curtissbacteria bacterium RBG_13_40_7]|uniref:Lipoprotein signal peptidase n=1 Tax=Candidatus Curtissbacteria bacterium RBG_13_40_7 TaxID=1797706 RepID=A0A1F5FZL7_9BACT|nr:MAG: hypothetical protein A2165_04045 [Candidatus Curtissbacteria bacterium RBG_13_40_7]